MDETGQPGAATPGEHGDGTGQHDDLAHSTSAWAPSAAGWSRAGDAVGSRREAALPQWRQPDPGGGWGVSSSRHGDLPAPLPGVTGETGPATRVNGRPPTNGRAHPVDEPPVARQAPVSAPPGPAEHRRDGDPGRLVVPAQRPGPPAEQQSTPYAVGEPEAGTARHASDDPSPARSGRWGDAGIPSSAPPAVQVPPVGTAASGFEVPPGFRAPGAVDRSGDDPRFPLAADPGVPPAGDDSGFPPAGEHPGYRRDRPGDEPDQSAGFRASDVRPTTPDADFPPEPPVGSGDRGDERGDFPPARAEWSRRAAPDDRYPPGYSGSAGDPSTGRRGRASGEADQPARDADRHARDAGRFPAAPGGDAPGGNRWRSTDRPEAGAADRGRPSWDGDWMIPPWAREESGPAREEAPATGGPAREEAIPADQGRDETSPAARQGRDEPGSAGRPSWDETHQVGRADRDEARGGRRSREDWSAGWAAARGETRPAYGSERDTDRSYEPWSGGRPAPSPAAPEDTPSWASSRPAAAPSSAPPVGPPGAPSSAPPARPPAAPSSAPPVRPAAAPSSAPPARPPGAPSSAPPVRPAAAPSSAPPARPAAAPSSAPPVRSSGAASGAPAAGPSGAPPRTDESGGYPGPSRSEVRNVRPFRLRPEGAEADMSPPAEVPGHPPAPSSGPVAAAATSGAERADLTPPAPVPTSAPPYAARRSAPDPLPTAGPAAVERRTDSPAAVLPQRVPAEPDVPVVPEPPAVEPPAETPELARIATHLRREDEPAPLQERPEGFDVNAILDAVRGVAGVRDAALRRTPAGAHSLRLDLADGADPAEVSRHVARLLQERMGLAAAPQNLPGSAPVSAPPPVRRRGADLRSDAEPRSAAGSRTENRSEPPPDVPRRRRQGGPHRGRATVEEPAGIPAPVRAANQAVVAAAGQTGPAGTPTGSPAAVGASYSGAQISTTETAPSRPLNTGGVPGPRVVIDHVQVSTFGLEANVEVRLLAGDRSAAGRSLGPAVDGYLLRLCAVAAAAAVDELLRGADPTSDRGRCFVEHTAVVPFGNCEVATVVVLLVCDGWVEQLAGSALVSGDPRQAVVRATLAAVNRRLEALLA